MDKSVKWQINSPPLSEYSESPTLSDSKPKTLKRKRSSIFSKLRKSILNSATSVNGDDNVKLEKRNELKRALSMDAGLQNRISQLATVAQKQNQSDSLDEQELPIIRKNNSNFNLRRSKSLINPPELMEMSSYGIGSTINSPASIIDEEEYESVYSPQATSLINTIETSHLHLNHQVFDCSWLAPTRNFHLFPGHLELNPQSSSIQFTCKHVSRSVRLKFNFDDILNISQGSWNNKRNQALIIDLMRGKRKTWVFVAWTEEQFSFAIDSLVPAWRLHCINKIKERIERRRAYLNIKCSRIMNDAERVATRVNISRGIWDDIKEFIKQITSKNEEHESFSLYKQLSHKLPDRESFELEEVLYEKEFSSVIPKVLSSILLEKSTNFMTNFRVLQRIETLNDSGWRKSHKNRCRTFNSIIKDEEGNIIFKWSVNQEIIFESTELEVFETILRNNFNDEISYKVVYEIGAIKDEEIDAEPSVYMKITSNLSNEKMKKYLKNIYFPALFQLLEAFIYESSCDFSYSCEEAAAAAQELIVLPPHYRFVRETLRNFVLQGNLFVTVVLLPFIYKLIYFKEYKIVRYSLLSWILLLSFRLSLAFLLNSIKTHFKPMSIEEEFEMFMKKLSREAIEDSNRIRLMKFEM